MNIQLEKLTRTYDYLTQKLREIPHGHLLVVEKYQFGLIITNQICLKSDDSKIFPTTCYNKFKQFIIMKHWQLDIHYIEGHQPDYFYVKTYKH